MRGLEPRYGSGVCPNPLPTCSCTQHPGHEESVSDTASPRRSAGIRSNLAIRPSVRCSLKGMGARCQATGFQWLEIKSFGMTDLSIERKSATNPDDFIYTQGDIEYVGTLELEYPG